MKSVITVILGMLGITAGSGFAVLVERLAIRWALVIAAVVAVASAYYGAYIAIKALASQVEATALSGISGDPRASEVFAWMQCLTPSTTSDAFVVLFSGLMTLAAVHFYWQVLKMNTTGF
jgi:hypothetical protein